MPLNDVIAVEISWMGKMLNILKLGSRLSKDKTCRSTIGWHIGCCWQTDWQPGTSKCKLHCLGGGIDLRRASSLITCKVRVEWGNSYSCLAVTGVVVDGSILILNFLNCASSLIGCCCWTVQQHPEEANLMLLSRLCFCSFEHLYKCAEGIKWAGHSSRCYELNTVHTFCFEIVLSYGLSFECDCWLMSFESDINPLFNQPHDVTLLCLLLGHHIVLTKW
jgi:hypothetical protein